MFKDAWNVICRLLLVAGVLLSLVALVEAFRVFVFFYRLGPVWGWSFVGVVAAVALVALFYLRSAFMAYPKVLKAPPLPDPADAGHHELTDYCRYLALYLDRLSRNPALPEELRGRAVAQLGDIEEVLGAHPLRDDLARLIAATEDDIIGPLLGELESVATKEVRQSVRDVMLGVTLSPYHSVDLLIVLYRNGAMVLRIVGIYASRPNTREQLLILRDVLRVVVTVNFLYIGRHLLENLFANVPLIGRIVDDIGQGLGAGLFTSAAGHAAMDRCAAYQGWNKAAAADSLASQTKTFLVDVRNIFTRDVLPDLRGRIQSETPAEKRDQPGFWDGVVRGINTSVDSTANLVDTLVVKPAVASTRGVVKAGSMVTRGVASATSSVTGGTKRRHRRKSSRVSSNPLRTLGQRIKYSWRGPPS